MKNEIDFPAVDEIVEACRAFVAGGGEIISRGFGDGVTCGCPMTVAGLYPAKSHALRGVMSFARGFDRAEPPSQMFPTLALRYRTGTEVRRRLEEEGLMGNGANQ